MTIAEVNEADIDKQDIHSEARILKNLNHPNILEFHQVIVSPGKLYLVTEFMKGGDLVQSIINEGMYTENELKKMFRQILQAL